jgi:cytochrome c oxidase subunit III
METREHSVGSRIGMWLFLCSEILLFGGLFLLYAVYRYKNPADFHTGSAELSRFDGTLNTCILLTSSLTAVAAIFSLQEKGNPRRAIFFLAATVGLGAAFLVVKGFEWTAKFEHGLYPNASTLLAMPKGVILYIGLYFTMTGLHALHVMIGMGILSTMISFIAREKVTQGHSASLENAGLYWHLVDIIWIFLFPLFYLIA